MSRARQRTPSPAPGKAPPGARRGWGWATGAVLLGVALLTFLFWRGRPAGTGQQPPTFNKEVAPIVFARCAYCHHPGEAAPFSLLTYADVRKRAGQIGELTAKRAMPPWLPEPGYGSFAETRSLTSNELATVQAWVAAGAPEGNARDLPPPPSWSGDWFLGKPDLVITPSLPYSLVAEGKDVYRNLVIPLPLTNTHFVRAVEFHPGNPRVVHHAFINVDETRQSRRLADKESPPGFDGMELPPSAIMPGGQLLGWQPGKTPHPAPEGLSWVLKPSMDMVLQLHLHPSGKPESVQPSIGLYFTRQAPTNLPFRIKLARFDFEIPPGVSNHLVETAYQLPVDVALLGILPHAHYLGKDLQAHAELPTGERRPLIWIRDWDFNWQGDYQYATPVSLPKGTRLVMRYTYDNTTNNVRNPHRPPKLVRNGLETTDEMAGLVLQAVAGSEQDRALLAKDYGAYFMGVSIDYYRFLVRLNPSDAEACVKLGRALAVQGNVSEGLEFLQRAVRLNPADDKGHYELGYLQLLQGRLPEAYTEFSTVARLQPGDHQAFGNLGVICLRLGKLDEAEAHLKEAVRLNPDDRVAAQNLERLRARRGTTPQPR